MLQSLSAMDASEALDYEVEALVCTYQSQVAVLSNDFPRLLAVTIKPNTGEDESKEYVRATLELVVDTCYPAEPPSILLSDTKGLPPAARCFSSFTLYRPVRSTEHKSCYFYLQPSSRGTRQACCVVESFWYTE